MNRSYRPENKRNRKGDYDITDFIDNKEFKKLIKQLCDEAVTETLAEMMDSHAKAGPDDKEDAALTYAEEHFSLVQPLSIAVNVFEPEYGSFGGLENRTVVVDFVPIVPANANMAKTFSNSYESEHIVICAVIERAGNGVSCDNTLSVLGKLYEKAIIEKYNKDFVAFDLQIGGLRTTSFIEPCFDFEPSDDCTTSLTSKSMVKLACREIPNFPTIAKNLLDDVDNRGDVLLGFAFRKI